MDPKLIVIPVIIVIAIAALGSTSMLPQNGESISDRESQTEAEIHLLVNEQRVEYGLEPLLYDREIGKIAKSHSMDMTQRDYFSHDSPNGTEPEDRGRNAGYDCTIPIPGTNEFYDGIVENIYKKEDTESLLIREPQSIAKETVGGWMDSSIHREAISDELLSVEGIGVSINQNVIYVTQNFC